MKNNRTSKKKSYADILEANFNRLEYQRRFGSLQKDFTKAPKKEEVTVKDIKAKKNDKNALSKLVSKAVFDDGEFVNLAFAEITIIRASFVFADMRGCDFSKSYLDSCDFSFADLRHCNFSNVVMRDCNFRHVNLKNVNFSGVDTIFCDFTGATF